MGYVQGDVVVHPQHGTVTVAGTIHKDAGNGAEKYLELYVTSSSMTILVPERSLREVGVRDLSTRTEAEAVLAVLQAPSDVSDVWSERNVLTVSRIKSTDLEQKSMVVRDLTRYAHRSSKGLTAGESRVLETCLDTVAMELSLALGISEDDTRALITEKVLAHEAPEATEQVPDIEHAGRPLQETAADGAASGSHS